MLRYFTTILFFCIGWAGIAQQPMFQWRDHLPYRTVVDVTASSDYIYAATPYAVIEVEKSSGEVSPLSKTNFLSGLNISAIQYDASLDALMIGYENGNFDIFTDQVFYNMPDIKLANVQGSKTINDIIVIDGIAHLSCDFGIVVIDIPKRSVIDSYFIRSSNVAVRSLQLHQDSLFAVTDQGIFKAKADNEYLRSYDSWEKDNGVSALLNGDENLTKSIVFDDQLLVLYENDAFESDTLYQYVNNTWSKVPNMDGKEIKDIRFNDDRIVMNFNYFVNSYDKQWNLIDNIFQFSFAGMTSTTSLWDGNHYWIGDQNYGIVKSSNSYNSTSYEPEGPFGLSAFQMHYQNGNIYVAGGSQTENWQSTYNRNGVYIYQDEEWKFFNYLNIPEMKFDSAFDYLAVAADPADDNHIFTVTSSTGGMFEIESDGTATRYNKNNSTLQDRSNNPGFYVLTDAFVDDEQTLWVANAFCGEPLVAKDKNGNWYSYSLGSAGTNSLVTDLYIDYNGVKWVSILNSGVVIFDDNGTLDDTSDDRVKLLNSGQVSGNLPNNIVTDVIMDLDNEIWIGTTEGFAVFYSPEQLFDDNNGDYVAQRVLIDGGENTEAVLGKAYITSIDVDGANRKWIGTKGAGVFCLSADGREEVYHFTVENSPLFSNNVEELSINHETGEVFISTDFGMLSFRSDATYGDDEFSAVKVFPNPVTPEYTGPITIQGLGFNSDVKITDIAGNLVFKGPSNGGTFVWDGLNLEGERVKTGVYLVIAGQTGEPKGKHVAKIMFIN